MKSLMNFILEANDESWKELFAVFEKLTVNAKTWEEARLSVMPSPGELCKELKNLGVKYNSKVEWINFFNKDKDGWIITEWNFYKEPIVARIFVTYNKAKYSLSIGWFKDCYVITLESVSSNHVGKKNGYYVGLNELDNSKFEK